MKNDFELIVEKILEYKNSLNPELDDQLIKSLLEVQLSGDPDVESSFEKLTLKYLESKQSD